jgi:hypothetical protein
MLVSCRLISIFVNVSFFSKLPSMIYCFSCTTPSYSLFKLSIFYHIEFSSSNFTSNYSIFCSQISKLDYNIFSISLSSSTKEIAITIFISVIKKTLRAKLKSKIWYFSFISLLMVLLVFSHGLKVKLIVYISFIFAFDYY